MLFRCQRGPRPRHRRATSAIWRWRISSLMPACRRSGPSGTSPLWWGPMARENQTSWMRSASCSAFRPITSEDGFSTSSTEAPTAAEKSGRRRGRSDCSSWTQKEPKCNFQGMVICGHSCEENNPSDSGSIQQILELG